MPIQLPIQRIAFDNLFNLSLNLYPGRGICIGVTPDGTHFVQVYWIMGRSDNSRNRVFYINEHGDICTKPADPSNVQDTSLTIYTAMQQKGIAAIVSNGAQTIPVLEETCEYTTLDKNIEVHLIV